MASRLIWHNCSSVERQATLFLILDAFMSAACSIGPNEFAAHMEED